MQQMRMRLTRSSRWGLSLLALLFVPVTWWVTVTDWDAEIFGLYTLLRMLLNLFLTATATGLCLLLFEIPALLFGTDYQTILGPNEPRDELHLSAEVNKPDPVLIHIHWPYSSFSGKVVGNLVQLGIPRPHRYKVDVQYDHNGFRNDRDYPQARMLLSLVIHLLRRRSFPWSSR